MKKIKTVCAHFAAIWFFGIWFLTSLSSPPFGGSVVLAWDLGFGFCDL